MAAKSACFQATLVDQAAKLGSFRPDFAAMRAIRMLLAAAAAAVAFAAAEPVGSFSRHVERRRMTEKDESGGEMHLSYEAVPRAGAIVLDSLSQTVVECDGHEKLRLTSKGVDAKQLQWHLQHADHTVFLVASSALAVPCGVGSSSPWYAQVAGSEFAAAADGVSVIVNAFSVNATNIFEKCE